MGLLSFLSDALGPVAKIIDDLHTSGEERLQAKEALIVAQAGIISQGLEYEKRMVELQSSVIQAEVQSESWVTRNWRPVTMLTFVSLIALNWFGIGPTELPPDLWAVIKLGLGGYVVGRSVEKVVPSVVAAVKAREE